MGGKRASWGTGRSRGWFPCRLTPGTHGFKESPRVWRIRTIPTLVGCVGLTSRGKSGFATVSPAREGPWPGPILDRGAQGHVHPESSGAPALPSRSPPWNPPPRSPTSPGERAWSRAPLSAPEARPRPSQCSPSSPLCLLGEGGRRRRPVPRFQSPSPAQLQPPPPTSSPKGKGTRASTGVPAPVFPRNHEP